MVGMNLLACEFTGIVWDARSPVMTVGNNQSVKLLCLAVGQRQGPPAPIQPLRCFYPCVETDMIANAKMGDILVEIFQQFGVMGIIWPRVWHRKIFECQPVFGCIDMQAFIAGRHAIRVVEIPIAANIVGGLKHFIGNAVIAEAFGGGKAGTSGTDNGDCGDHVHVETMARFGRSVTLSTVRVLIFHLNCEA